MDDAGRDDVGELTLEPATIVRSRRPRALWGVLAAVALAAGALVVTSANDDDGTRPGLPVALGSAGRNEATGAMAADSMLAWVTYVAGDDLPALGGEAPAYRLVGSVDETQVRALADALDVDGELVHEGPAWKIADADGTLEVYEGRGAQWWYSSTSSDDPVSGSGSSAGGGAACTEAPADAAAHCSLSTVTTFPACTASDGPAECVSGECPAGADCAIPLPTDPPVGCPPGSYCDCIAAEGGIVGCGDLEPPVDADCAKANDVTCPDDTADPPTPPADLPSGDEARAIALELLAATGVDVDGADVTVDGPYDAWYVTVEPRIDGVGSGLVATASVRSGGLVTNAGGYLGTPERLGDYPVLDTRAAIDRANAQQGDGSAYRGGVAMDTAVGRAEATAGDDPVTTTAAVEDRPAECEACDGDGEGTVSTETGCPEGSSSCNGVGVTAEPPATYPYPCKVQPDGSKICETEPGCVNTAGEDAMDRVLVCELPACPQVVPPVDEPLGAPETIECTPPLPDPGGDPVPELEPVEIVLVDAAPSHVLLGAIDGSTDAYLVPGYRFTDADGGRVDLPAVADEALTGQPSTGATVTGDPIVPDPGGVDPVEPPPCGEVLVEEDASGTTHTVQPNPDCVEPAPTGPVTLPAGEEPQIGVGYQVDVDTECHGGSFVLGVTWNIVEGDVSGWSSPREGGTFTMDTPDHGTFVGDSEGSKTATFRPRSAGAEYGCAPAPRG